MALMKSKAWKRLIAPLRFGKMLETAATRKQTNARRASKNASCLLVRPRVYTPAIRRRFMPPLLSNSTTRLLVQGGNHGHTTGLPVACLGADHCVADCFARLS